MMKPDLKQHITRLLRLLRAKGLETRETGDIAVAVFLVTNLYHRRCFLLLLHEFRISRFDHKSDTEFRSVLPIRQISGRTKRDDAIDEP